MGRKALLVTVVCFFAVGLLLARVLERIEGGSVSSGAAAPRTATPGSYRRVICLAPSITETIFALGGGSQIVAVGDFTFWPPEATKLPRAGGVFNPSFERMLALRPDLVILQGRQQKVADFCARQRIEFLAIEKNDFDGVFDGIRAVGETLGLAGPAEVLAAQIRLDLAGIRRRVAGRGRPRVFLCIGRRPGTLSQLMTAGTTSYLSQLVEAAGGTNIFGELERPYPMISKESLVVRAPQVIIETYAGQTIDEAKRRELAAEWRPLRAIPAVRDGRIAILTEDYLLIPGPRMAKSAERLAEVIHPEAFEK